MEGHRKNPIPKKMTLQEMCRVSNAYTAMLHGLFNTHINQDRITLEEKKYIKRKKEERMIFENILLQQRASNDELLERLESLLKLEESLIKMTQKYREDCQKLLLNDKEFLEYEKMKKDMQTIHDLTTKMIELEKSIESRNFRIAIMEGVIEKERTKSTDNAAKKYVREKSANEKIYARDIKRQASNDKKITCPHKSLKIFSPTDHPR